MKAKGISVVGVLLIIVLIAIAITLAFPMYRANVVENARAQVCESNLKTLKAALDLYSADHDIMPGDLSKLPDAYIQKAYAKVLKQQGGVAIRIARAIIRWNQRGIAHAGLLNTLAGGAQDLLKCPSDETPPEQGGISYALNARLISMKARDYGGLPGNYLLIVDSERATFSDLTHLASRHEYAVFGSARYYANTITKDGTISKYYRKPTRIVRRERSTLRTRGEEIDLPPIKDK